MTRLVYIKMIIFSIILTPWITLFKGLPDFRPEWFITIIGLIVFSISRRPINSRIAFWAILVYTSMLSSMVYGMLFMGITISVSDFTELLKPILYFLTFYFVATATYSLTDYIIVLQVVLICFGVAAVIAVIQFFAPGSIAPLLLLWAPEERIDLYVLSRATGTMGNANDLGFLMNLGFALTLFTLRHRVLPLSCTSLLLILNFAGVFASGSRTALICLVVIISTYVLVEMKKNAKSLIFVTGLVVSIVWLFQNYAADFEMAAGLLDRISSLGNIESDTAWQPRVQGALETLSLIKESLFFGHGPAKQAFTVADNIDNEYILLLFRYGIFGLISIAGLGWALAMQQKPAVYKASPLLASMRNFSWATLVAGAIFAYTAGLFSSFRLFGLLIVLWTISTCVRSESRSAIERHPVLT